MPDNQNRLCSLAELSPRAAWKWLVPVLAALGVAGLWAVQRFGKLPPAVAAWLEPSLLTVLACALVTGLGLVGEWLAIEPWKRAVRRTRGFSAEQWMTSDAWPARAYQNCAQRAARDLSSLDPNSVKQVVGELRADLDAFVGRRWVVYLGLAFATSVAGALCGAWNLTDAPGGVALAQGLRHCAVGIGGFFVCLLGIVCLSLAVGSALREWQNQVCQLSEDVWKLAEPHVPEREPPTSVVYGGTPTAAPSGGTASNSAPLSPPTNSLDPFGFSPSSPAVGARPGNAAAVPPTAVGDLPTSLFGGPPPKPAAPADRPKKKSPPNGNPFDGV